MKIRIIGKFNTFPPFSGSTDSLKISWGKASRALWGITLVRDITVSTNIMIILECKTCCFFTQPSWQQQRTQKHLRQLSHLLNISNMWIVNVGKFYKLSLTPQRFLSKTPHCTYHWNTKNTTRTQNRTSLESYIAETLLNNLTGRKKNLKNSGEFSPWGSLPQVWRRQRQPRAGSPKRFKINSLGKTVLCIGSNNHNLCCSRCRCHSKSIIATK